MRPAQQTEREAITALLTSAGLPVEDLDPTMLDSFVVASEDGAFVGVVGLEICETDALLRSLAVDRGHRRRGLGARLVAAIETEARARGVNALYLLTITATSFFTRVGYTACDRAGVPPAIAGTSEFSPICPAGADCLYRHLTP